jgi:secreted trypsin-like serine protease
MVAQKRIIGGQTATFGELPWQAHIRISGFQCGGVLVNHYYVATAGSTDLFNGDAVYSGETIYDTKLFNLL